MDELVEKARNGNAKAFVAAVDGMKEQMYKTAFMQLKNEHDALDAVQEAFSKAFSGIRSLREARFFKTWLVRILLNECHNIQRQRRKVIPMSEEVVEYCEKGQHYLNESNVEVSSIIDGLEDIYRKVVDLRYNHDLKLEEIASVLDIPVGTVKSRLNRALKLLKLQYLEKEVLP